ncbi:MAG: aminoacyl-tRNA hydrolase [Rhodospirillaceae bacterium]|nr:aminoacyl-tRNA hydrolase [Rhodospirillaceae bacterium]
MLLLAGLGNPGTKFAGHRHNVGFMALDAIVQRHGFGQWRSRFSGELAEGSVAGHRVLALKPMTHVNMSGLSVGQAVRFLKLEPGDITVIYDELDLVPGKVRVKVGGGHGGHNGIRNIAAHIGPGFRRVRLGIGHPGDKNLVSGYVLRDFTKADRKIVDHVVEVVVESLPILIAGDDNRFMTRVSHVLNPPPPKPPGPDYALDEQAAEALKEGKSG